MPKTCWSADEIERAYRHLTPEEQVELDQLLSLTDAPPSFEDFARATLPFDLHAWQKLVLCPLIERLAFERGVRVAFHAPPQYGKSILLAQRAPGYLLGVDPLHRVGLACYNETHASGFGAVVRDLMLTDEYEKLFSDPRCRVKKDAAEGKFFTAGRKALADGQPSFTAMGLLSGFTGKGVDTLIIDDPYKSAEEASSEVINDKVWRFWKDTASVRIGEEANVVVMFHRYHDDDLAARLLAEGGWEYIRLPVIADENEDGADPTGREVGELLSSMRSQAWVDVQRRTNPRTFAGQFQGKPRADEGGIFKQAWFRYYEDEGEFYVLHHANGRQERVRKEDCWYFASGDFAASEQTSADWTVVSTWAVTPRRQRLLVRVAREQWEGPEAKGLVRTAFQVHPLAYAAVERNGLALPMVQDLIREGYPIRGVVVHRDKIARAQGNAAYYESGVVFHPSGNPDWLALFEAEHLAFGPVCKYDDQVDTGSIAAETVKPELEIITEFSPALHVEQELAFDAALPLVNGWSFDPFPAWVLGQLDATGGDREGTGQFRVLACLAGGQEEGPYAFGERVLNYYRRCGEDPARLSMLHITHPRHCGVKGYTGKHLDAWLSLGAGLEVVVGYEGLRPETNGRPPFGIELTPGEGSRETRDESLRARLRSLERGRPALVVDEACTPLIAALSGGYAWKVQVSTGMPTGEVEPNVSAALVEALTVGLSGLYAAGPRPTQEEHYEVRGSASGAGRRRARV